MSLTIGSMELGELQIVAGVKQLIYGVTQLMLLVFGVALACTFAAGAGAGASTRMGDWALYVAMSSSPWASYVYRPRPRGRCPG